ncbi:M23 family metallopeptidase [Novosphingobium sp.]|uniref:M23 family metallopeptidase n=1 Tax=Novosphingobium sp. TaxID=1874826 RepID=UPI0033417C29
MAAGLIAQPALASSAASADITAPLRAAEAGRNGTASFGSSASDSEFRQLFANWRALDNGRPLNGFGSSSLADTGSASIPMLVPVTSNRAMSSNFGMRTHPVLGGYRMHKGVDLPASTGTPIHATADGVIGRADWFGGYGLCVEIEHGANLETRYGHMSRIAVAEGQHVHKGDVIGYVGSTGRSTGAHLHYEVRIGGEAVNPVPYLQIAEASAGIVLASNGTAPTPDSPEE